MQQFTGRPDRSAEHFDADSPGTERFVAAPCPCSIYGIYTVP